MRCIATLILAGTIIASNSAFAGEGTLRPGRPAGVKPAQDFMEGNTLLLVGLGAAVVAGIAVAVSDNGTATAAAAGATVITPSSTITTATTT
jgi:hypothetical protein